MWLSVDFGGSTIDVLSWGRQGTSFEVLEMVAFERSRIFHEKTEDIGTVLQELPLTGTLEGIFVTGGKSRFFPHHFREISLEKIPEVEAIGRGGHFLLHQDGSLKEARHFDCLLVVSMGTGTCMVKLEQAHGNYIASTHVGGTGVGGGTLLGLSNLLLQETEVDAISSLLEAGDAAKVDLSVRDIIGGDLGHVPGNATAANLARLARRGKYQKADLAAGIGNLVAQTIALQAIFSARSIGASAVLLTGKLTRFQKIVNTMLAIGTTYGMPMMLPRRASAVSAFGAFHKFFHASAPAVSHSQGKT